MNPENDYSSVWYWNDFLKDLDFDENGEVTAQIPHKDDPEKFLTVKFKRIDLGGYNE